MAEGRRQALELLGLSPGIVALAMGEWPTEAFEFRCGRLDRSLALPAGVWPPDALPLWECCGSIVGCRRAGGGLEFIGLDVEVPGNVHRLARSEEGLLFWLFSYLIEDQDWDDEPSARRAIAHAAAALGFRRLDEVDQFQQQLGGRTDYDELLRAAALEIEA
jgi:hypothetical protein